MSEKSDLVLVHGLLGSLSFFDPATLLPGLNVLSPDMHGYGNSPPKDYLSLQDQVDYLKQFIDAEANGACWLLGHSVGGAIVNMFAAQYPELVKGIINVEGNFTIKDAFWCQAISEKNPEHWAAEYQLIVSDPEKWLVGSKISLSAQRVLWAKEILAYQQANSVQAVAKAVVADTDSSQYRSIVGTVMDSDIPVFLVAGEHSVKEWNIPTSVRAAARELCVLSDSGHMMMLEKPEEFCDLIKRLIPEQSIA